MKMSHGGSGKERGRGRMRRKTKEMSYKVISQFYFDKTLIMKASTFQSPRVRLAL